MLTFRTVRRLVLAILVAAIVAPVGVIVGLGLYYRSDAYCAYVERQLEEATGLRVSLGRVERVGWRGLRLLDLRIGSTIGNPVIAAAAANGRRDQQGLYAFHFDGVRLALRSSQDLRDLLTLALSARRVQRFVSGVEFRNAACEGGAAPGLSETHINGTCRFGAGWSASLEGEAAGTTPWRVSFGPAQGGERPDLSLESIPATALQVAGVLPDVPLGEAVANGTCEFSAASAGGAAGMWMPTNLRLRFSRLAIGPIAEPFGLNDVALTAPGTYEEALSGVQPAKGGAGFSFEGVPEGPAWMTPLALEKLAFLLRARPAEALDTADRVPVTQVGFAFAREKGGVRVRGLLDPPGTVLLGGAAGSGASRPLLRLEQTWFADAEFDQRLGQLRRGEFRPASRPVTSHPVASHPVTPQPTSEPDSRPSE